LHRQYKRGQFVVQWNLPAPGHTQGRPNSTLLSPGRKHQLL
jgi:hypothetical protein